MKKARSAIALIMILIVLAGIPAFAAAPGGGDLPEWNYASEVKHFITISGAAGAAKAAVKGISGVSYIEGDLKVYKLTGSGSWDLIGSDAGYSSSNDLILVASFAAESGARYKSVLTATVYYMGAGETVTSTVYKNN